MELSRYELLTGGSDERKQYYAQRDLLVSTESDDLTEERLLITPRALIGIPIRQPVVIVSYSRDARHDDALVQMVQQAGTVGIEQNR